MPNATKGFASMTKAKRRTIARLGGIAAHAKGRAHTYSSEEAKIAGRKGGLRRNITRKRGMNT